MKLRTKIILFIALVHGTAIALSFYVFRENRIFFLVAEAAILVSLAIAWSLYQELTGPFRLLLRGADAIRDRDFSVKFTPTGSPEMDRLIEVYNQMIDQLRAERTAQQEQHYFLEKLVQTAPVGMLLLDYDNRITGINPKALEWLDKAWTEKELIGRSPGALPHPLFQAMHTLIAGGSETVTRSGQRTFKIKKGEFLDRGFKRTFLMLEDLTSEILEAEKRSYGMVIRMMAHEVNNSIGAVNSILDTARTLPDLPPDMEEGLRVAIARNDHLNRFMRNFAEVIRLPAPRPEPFDLRQLAGNVAQLMNAKAREQQVNLEWEPPAQPVPVYADEGQMEQVLVNVVKNALEACAPGNTIRLSVSGPPGRLAVSNNGTPIPEETAARLFSPFFTTRNGGQGIGLTLAREILNAHGFAFSLRTEADGWTHFRINCTDRKL